MTASSSLTKRADRLGCSAHAGQARAGDGPWCSTVALSAARSACIGWSQRSLSRPEGLHPRAVCPPDPLRRCPICTPTQPTTLPSTTPAVDPTGSRQHRLISPHTSINQPINQSHISSIVLGGSKEYLISPHTWQLHFPSSRHRIRPLLGTRAPAEWPGFCVIAASLGVQLDGLCEGRSV